MSRFSHRGARDGVEPVFPMLDPIPRNYPTRKGEVGVGCHTNPHRGP